jgi:hypothetical protein
MPGVFLAIRVRFHGSFHRRGVVAPKPNWLPDDQ